MRNIPKHLKQHTGETLSDYKDRIISAKQKNEDLEIGWDDIAILTGYPGNGENLKNNLEGFLGTKRAEMTYPARDRERAYTQQEIEDMTEKERIARKAEKEKIKFQDQRREERKLLRDEAREENILEHMYRVVEEIKKERPFSLKPVDLDFTPNQNREAALLFSDWHVGSWQHNYLNHYDSNILEERVKSILSKAISYCRNNNVNTVHVFILGDIVSGLIHVST